MFEGAIFATFVSALLVGLRYVFRSPGDENRRAAWWVRWAVRAAAVVFPVVIFAWVTLGGLPGAAGTGAVIVSLMAVSLAREQRKARSFARLCAALSGPEPEQAWSELGNVLARARTSLKRRKNGYVAYARLALHVALRASQAGLDAKGMELLASLDPLELGELCGLCVLQLASMRFKLRDRAGARQAIGLASRPASPAAVERSLSALEALLDALEGDASVRQRAEAALASAAEQGIRGTWRAVQAHALASSGAHDAAREALAALQAEQGDVALQQVVAHDGPASPLAGSLLAGAVHAYR
jgi:hypothetical protein